jgi:hypothetical protein
MSNNNLDKLMKTEYTYPSPSKDTFQSDIYKKREFFINRKAGRDLITTNEDIKEYQDNICSRKFALHEHQSFLSNFINPDTPYKGVLVFHGTGTGKCMDGKSLVLLNDKLIPIEKIWKQYNSNIISDIDNGEWSNTKEDIYIRAYDNNKIIKKTVKRLYRQYINELMKEVILENGLSIKITQSHKLLTKKGWTNIITSRSYVGIPKDYLHYYSNIKNDNTDDSIIYIKVDQVNNYYYNGYVYDLEVDKYHNYIANGILCHNTCAGIAIAEKFKPLIQKYNTKIYVLVSGPLIKESWKYHLIKCTGETYLKKKDNSIYISDTDKQKARKNAVNIALQYYRFMSYRSFYKKVLGDKIVEKVRTKDNKIKASYRKTKEGEFERDIAIDRIYNLNNSLIIIDEAHNLTGNAYGEALMKIIKNSHNLKIVLLTATPMKNLADDIIQLINFIRPIKSPMLRDKIFSSEKNHLMKFKPGGIDYLKKMTLGYVSYLRGADPLTFAKRVEKGVIPKGLLFTNTIQCNMLKFQLNVYKEAIKDQDDTLDRRSEAVANFAFPGLSQDRKSIVGYYGREGINIILNQLKTNYELLNRKIASDILKIDETEHGDLIYPSENNKTISGEILKMKYLKNFSIKFFRALKKINRLIWSKKGSKTAFVYSNLVKVGIELFTEILLQNGYLEYDEDPGNYKLSHDTRCYYCGLSYKEHQQRKIKITSQMSRTKLEESSTEYNKKKGDIPYHKFYPATFIPVTGKATDETTDIIPEDKQRILDNVFSSIENREGKFIKLVLGSKVMNEGISLKNVAEVHILDVYFNLGRVDQVIGRAIRHCSHYGILTDKERFPNVNVYKYAVHLENELSSEEEMYKKAEMKYMLIKKVERAIKQIAIDCPLNRHGNVFPEELEEFKNCKKPTEKITKDDILCPSRCDYTECDFECDGPVIKSIYWDSKNRVYRKVPKKDLDYTTFTQSLAKTEIEDVKAKIKDLYRIKYVYTLEQIINYVRNSFKGDKKELFDEFFCFKALDELIPITENDFNNFKDTVFDKFNRPGYLIYINKYYIFQPFDQIEDVPMYYRSTYDKPMKVQLTLYNYLKNSTKYKEIKSKSKQLRKQIDKKIIVYDFDSVMEYYDARKEFDYVGIIDKESMRRKNKRIDELHDVFKIREKRQKILDKKRGTGIPSLKGAVCATSKDKEYLEKISKKLKIKLTGNETRTEICNLIRKNLLFLEKYSTFKNKNKMTYVIIPKNHPTFAFPYNLEDRAKYIVDQIKDKIKFSIDMDVKKIKHSIGDKKDLIKYNIIIKDSSKLDDFHQLFKSLGGKLEKKTWTFILD